jgi:hypothetical protein
VVAAIAFGLSVVLRSDTYAMLGSLGLMIIVGPLLGLIPTIGKYMPSQLAADGADVSIVPASLTLAAAIGALGLVAATTFQRRDV